MLQKHNRLHPKYSKEQGSETKKKVVRAAGKMIKEEIREINGFRSR